MPPIEGQGEQRPQLSRRELLLGLGATAIATLGCAGEGGPEDGPGGGETIEFEPGNDFFDKNPDYLRPVTKERGEYTKEQRKKLKRTLRPGVTIFEDVGLTFYLVQKGDTISEIRQKLGKYKEYDHLHDQSNKLESFNIPARKLQADRWIPIPMENIDRHLTEGQFAQYAAQAIKDLRHDPNYGDELAGILEEVNTRELLATFMAIAKQEGGGKPLGQFELHRWEDHQQAFSFSYFHILMKGPGLKARRKLNLTEGQVYHPQNAVKLLLGFLAEKSAETLKKPARFFPLPKHYEDFAKFYNGRSWKKTNPHYVKNISRYHDDALKHLVGDDGKWRK